MVREYLRLLVFAMGLLAGVQIPGFIDQYQKRVDAHLREARQNITGFQSTANHFFKGNISALIAHYEGSPDKVFAKDAASVKQLYERLLHLEAEAESLKNTWYRVAIHVASRFYSPLFQETMSQFSHTIPLTREAIGWGLGMALLLISLTDLLLGIFAKLLGIHWYKKTASA